MVDYQGSDLRLEDLPVLEELPPEFRLSGQEQFSSDCSCRKWDQCLLSWASCEPSTWLAADLAIQAKFDGPGLGQEQEVEGVEDRSQEEELKTW